MVDFDKLEVDVFNTRPIFYSKEHDFYSHSLTDFKNLLDNEKTEAVVLRAPAKGLFLKQVIYD